MLQLSVSVSQDCVIPHDDPRRWGLCQATGDRTLADVCITFAPCTVLRTASSPMRAGP